MSTMGPPLVVRGPDVALFPLPYMYSPQCEMTIASSLVHEGKVGDTWPSMPVPFITPVSSPRATVNVFVIHSNANQRRRATDNALHTAAPLPPPTSMLFGSSHSPSRPQAPSHKTKRSASASIRPVNATIPHNYYAQFAEVSPIPNRAPVRLRLPLAMHQSDTTPHGAALLPSRPPTQTASPIPSRPAFPESLLLTPIRIKGPASLPPPPVPAVPECSPSVLPTVPVLHIARQQVVDHVPEGLHCSSPGVSGGGSAAPQQLAGGVPANAGAPMAPATICDRKGVAPMHVPTSPTKLRSPHSPRSPCSSRVPRIPRQDTGVPPRRCMDPELLLNDAPSAPLYALPSTTAAWLEDVARQESGPAEIASFSGLFSMSYLSTSSVDSVLGDGVVVETPGGDILRMAPVQKSVIANGTKRCQFGQPDGTVVSPRNSGQSAQGTRKGGAGRRVSVIAPEDLLQEALGEHGHERDLENYREEKVDRIQWDMHNMHIPRTITDVVWGSHEEEDDSDTSSDVGW
eukprot:GGOE01044205.1.p1 GENE.GGOE01044205.1~~GGOE01044205.1.p1  ORF type:complete len:524 (-),score=45.53 GGOE01044205.1:270-1814(-)